MRLSRRSESTCFAVSGPSLRRLDPIADPGVSRNARIDSEPVSGNLIQSPAISPWTPNRAPNNEPVPEALVHASIIPARPAFRTAVGPPLWTTSACDSLGMNQQLVSTSTKIRDHKSSPGGAPPSRCRTALGSRKVTRQPRSPGGLDRDPDILGSGCAAGPLSPEGVETTVALDLYR